MDDVQESCKKTSKKPFDKKKWRQEKYSKKAKVQQLQEKRRLILKKKLEKQLAREGLQTNKEKRKKNPEEKKLSRLREAQLEYERRKEQERLKAEEARKIREEKLRKIKEIRLKKAERTRKLSQKTRKGQPLMRARLEMLQEKIEKMVAQNKL